MNKKDVLELKRRLKKDSATFTKLHGCYVNADKVKVTSFEETFLNLDDDELLKYLEIAKKILSGNLGNNILELSVPIKEEQDGGKQKSLMALRQTRLKNADMVDAFFDNIINNYDYVGNYLILLFHDAYDIIKKTTDGDSLDESEEVYEYLLCAICPVELSKPGLGYLEDENDIGPRIRDWVVGMPSNGFIFPAFSDRSTDIHAITYYTKNPKDTHPELMEDGLGCPAVLSIAEKKEVFEDIVGQVADIDEEEGRMILEDIQMEFNDLILENEGAEDGNENLVAITYDTLNTALEDAGLQDEQIKTIQEEFKKNFEDGELAAYQLVDQKMIASAEKRRERLELMEQITTLKQQLEPAEKNVKIYVPKDKENKIIKETRDGIQYICIPVNVDDKTVINGREKNV